MQHWKLLVLGITGDLAKLKVLPAISEFAEKKQAEVQIDLIGYSRSAPDTKQIERILNESHSHGKHVLSSISYFQGQYNDATFFDSLYNATTEDDKLIIYMAVPPSVFLEFLENSCPHNDKNIEIILEKPFGQDPEEAQKILKTIYSCKLTKKVHFFDHYLYKSEMQLSKAELSNLKFLKNQLAANNQIDLQNESTKVELISATKSIVEIKIQALETLTVGKRGRYYDTIGAIKDMFPHLFSMLCLNLEIVDPNFNLNNFQNFDINTLSVGQYQGYIDDVENTASKTETYFRLEGEISNFKIVLESGKSLEKKLTQITTLFSDGSKLIWNVAPDKKLTYESDTENFSLGLDKQSFLDHTNMFENLLNGGENNFVTAGQVLTSWWMFSKIGDFLKFSRTKLGIYTKDDLDEKINHQKQKQAASSIENLEKSKVQFEESLDALLNQEFILGNTGLNNQKSKVQL